MSVKQPYYETMVAMCKFYAAFVGPPEPIRFYHGERPKLRCHGSIRFDADGTCHDTLEWRPWNDGVDFDRWETRG